MRGKMADDIMTERSGRKIAGMIFEGMIFEKRGNVYCRKAALLLLILLGSWQCANGAYVYAKATLAQQLITMAWEQSLGQTSAVKPWSWADTWPTARLVVPKYDVDLIVLAGDNGQALAFGPGHRQGSAQPGKAGNTLISAHRDTNFQFLQYLQPQDAIFLQTQTGEMYEYAVKKREVVDKAAPIYSDENEYQLTLVTCFPFNTWVAGGPLRYVITAERVWDS